MFSGSNHAVSPSFFAVFLQPEKTIAVMATADNKMDNFFMLFFDYL
jgi:hypothetical protein